MADATLDLVQHLAVMKPAKVDNDNAKALIKLADAFKSPDYVLEDKIDGCHYTIINGRFFSTDLIEKTNNYPHLRDFFLALGMPNLILDGEINYPGKTSQYCTRVTGSDPSTAVAFQNANGPIHYTFWDMLRTPAGTWLLNKPLSARRVYVEHFYNKFVKGTAMEPYIHLTQFKLDDKKKVADQWIANGGEGAVLKRLDSLYSMGKSPAWQWIKYKVKDYSDLFISGYEPAKVEYTGSSYDSWPYWLEINGTTVPVTKFHYYGWIGALELSAYVDGVETRICTCAGIDEKLRKDISENPGAYMNRVIKISYMEKTEAGYPRHPRFEEFHESKLAKECTWQFNE